MKILVELFLLIGLLGVDAWAVPTPPAPIPGGTQIGGSLRAFVDRDSLSYFAEAAAVNETGGRELKDYSLGVYYHVSPAFKFGTVFSRDFGLRHNEDWTPTNGIWSWNDSNGRGETLVALDATAKAVVDFLPGEDWVAEFKTRYIYNSFNDNRTLMLRPGLTYFYLREGSLAASFFIRFEYDFPLNYGAEAVNEKWIYLGALYHLCENVDLGPTITEGWQTWNRPAAYAIKGGAPYSITTQTSTYGLSGVLHF